MSKENVLKVDDNVNSDFVESGISNVRAYEEKIRNARETQKQELRTLVGEQYQELISAADAIITMSKNARAVQSNLKKMQLDCNVEAIKANARRSIKTSEGGPRRRASIDAKRKYIYIIAALVKSLADVPEQIWHALENHRYLHASRLYTLARKVQEYLEDEKQRSPIDIDIAFPVIQRQWDAVSLFEPQILQRATHYLRVSEQASEHIAEIAVGLMLLDGLSYKDCVDKLLEMRTDVIRDLIQSCAKSNTMDSRLTHQIREITLTIKRTMLALYDIFISKENGHESTLIESYVMSFQKTFLIPSRLSHGNETPTQPAVTRLFSPSSNVHLIVRYLPESIQKYTPEFSPDPRLQPSDVRRLLEEWIDKIKNLLQDNLPGLLSTIKTHADLVSIRSKLWTVLDADENAKASSSSRWQSTTEKLLGTTFSIWDNFYRAIFNNRAKSLIDDQLEEMAAHPRTLVWPSIVDAERSTLKKEFSITVNTRPDNTIKNYKAFSLPNLSSSTEIQTFKSALTETTNDRTRLLGKLQTAFDVKLEKIRKDVQEHMRFQNANNDHFHAVSDASAIKEYYQERCYASLLEYCRGLNSLMEQLASLDWMDLKTRNLVNIFLGRLARNLALSSKELPSSITLSPTSSETTIMFELRSKKKQQDPKLSKLQEHLLHTFHKAHDPWLSFLSEKFSTALKKTMALLKWTDKCPAIKIWEDMEGNVRLPINASSAIVRELFCICVEIQHINSTILDQITLDKLKQLLRESVKNVYAEHVKDIIDKGLLSENGAIQMTFDYYFLTTVLKDQEANLIQDDEIVQILQEQINAAKWASFELHLKANVNKFYGKQALIFRVLTGGSSQSYERTKKVVSSQQQEQFNVLPMAPQTSRFTLLPVGHLTSLSFK